MDKYEPPTDGKPGNGGNQHRHKGDLSLSPLTQLADYSDENRPRNQFCVSGVPLNPSLRPDFDMTDINDRDSEELNDWFNRPYIVTKGWNDIEAALNADRELSRSAFAPNTHNDFEARLDQAMITHGRIGSINTRMVSATKSAVWMEVSLTAPPCGAPRER